MQLEKMILPQYDDASIRASGIQAGLQMVFNVIWTFTKCNEDWIRYSMIAKLNDIPPDVYVPEDAIPVVHYGIDTEATTPVGLMVYKVGLNKVKQFLGLEQDAQLDLGDNWWPWALAAGVLQGGWNESSTLDGNGLSQIVHALSGYDVERIEVNEDVQKRLYPDYIDYADVTPTFARISLNDEEDHWVSVMTTTGTGDDRTIDLASVWSSNGDVTTTYDKSAREEQRLVWKEILRLESRPKDGGGSEPTYFDGTRPGGPVDPSAFGGGDNA